MASTRGPSKAKVNIAFSSKVRDSPVSSFVTSSTRWPKIKAVGIDDLELPVDDIVEADGEGAHEPRWERARRDAQGAWPLCRSGGRSSRCDDADEDQRREDE